MAKNSELDADTMVKEAEALEDAVKKDEDDPSVYTHTFKKPFRWMNNEYTKLTFDFSTLTGKDSLAIEREVMSLYGKTTVMPEFTPEYLVGMLARSCTERSSDGKRAIGVDAFDAVPLGDFQSMTKAARRFLLRYGS